VAGVDEEIDLGKAEHLLTLGRHLRQLPAIADVVGDLT
jgi:hypothetical protein